MVAAVERKPLVVENKSYSVVGMGLFVTLIVPTRAETFCLYLVQTCGSF